MYIWWPCRWQRARVGRRRAQSLPPPRRRPTTRMPQTQRGSGRRQPRHSSLRGTMWLLSRCCPTSRERGPRIPKWVFTVVSLVCDFFLLFGFVCSIKFPCAFKMVCICFFKCFFIFCLFHSIFTFVSFDYISFSFCSHVWIIKFISIFSVRIFLLFLCFLVVP